MRHLSTHIETRSGARWLTILVLMVGGCSGDYFGDDCHAPAFKAGVEPTWAPCGCGNYSGDTQKWVDACPLETHYCMFSDNGGTCTPRCEVDADCPAHPDGHAATCGYNGHCVLPCTDDASCPQGFHCLDGFGCLHDFEDPG